VIRVSLSVLVFIFLGLMVGPIFGAWLLNEYRRSRRERAAFRYVIRCTACSLEFEDRTRADLPRCPRCAALNERVPVMRI
jgi:DNA-directed RNA polymerase subunit RPC12/RpoP